MTTMTTTQARALSERAHEARETADARPHDSILEHLARVAERRADRADRAAAALVWERWPL